jgi:hypothetical protein
MGDLYNYKKTGTLYGKDFSRESFNWSARVNNVFRVTPLTRVQADLITEAHQLHRREKKPRL